MLNHQFAKFYLHNKGVKLYSGKKQVLEYDSSLYDMFKDYSEPPQPKIIASEHFLDFKHNKDYSHEIYFKRLSEFGFGLAQKMVTDTTKTNPRQRKVYFIARLGTKAEFLLYHPPNHKIIYDPINKYIQLWGANAGYDPETNSIASKGRGPKISLERKTSIPKPKDVLEWADRQRSILLGKPIEVKLREITLKNEIPVIFTEDDELVTIPKNFGNPHTIVIVGRRGKGKSMLTNSVACSIKYYYNDELIWLNDSLNQFHSLMLPFVDYDKIGLSNRLTKINMKPNPLPAINFYMSAPNLNMLYGDEGVSFRLVLDFKELLNNYSYMAQGIKKMDIGSPEKYISELSKEFLKFNPKGKSPEYIAKKHLEHIKEVMLDKTVIGAKGKPMPKYDSKMMGKWLAALKDFFDLEFTGNLFPQCDVEWRVETKDKIITATPIIASYEAGLVPVINTSFVKGLPHFKNWIGALQNKIFDWQRHTTNKKTVYVVVDENQDIYEEGSDSIISRNAKEAQENLFKQGRHNQIGYVCNTQSFHGLNDDIKRNTTHLITTLVQDSSERNAIAKNFFPDLDDRKLVNKVMAKLETFEVLLISNEPLNVYTPDGYIESKSGAFKGIIIPPMANHLKSEVQI